MSGKTGTTQVRNFAADDIYTRCDARPIFQRHHGWFVAYAPADNPEIAVAVLAQHSCSGSRGAAPVVKDIMTAYFEKYHPEMIKAAQERKALRGKVKGKMPASTPPPAEEGVD